MICPRWGRAISMGIGGGREGMCRVRENDVNLKNPNKIKGTCKYVRGS
jgi:hypothetical protein